MEAYYNFGEATLGDIDLDIETDGRLFENFRISRTTFDGFDFSRYHYALSPEWNLHTFAGQTDVDYDTEASRFELGDRVDAEELIDGAAASTAEEVASSEDHSGTFDRLTGISKRLGPTRILHAAAQALREAPALETTYLKAKNGANEVGDSRAASSFFVREMYYRRNSHVKRAVASSERVTTRIRAGLLACMNLLLSISCGYGEKPYRTLLFSLGTVVVYWPIYVAVLDTPPFGTFPGYLLFSFQSFTALMLGVDTEMFGLLGTFVAVSQGFVGAFLIGLFVFTLTRSIHR